MKGLLRNNFIEVIENIKILLPIVVILEIFVCITGSASLLNLSSLAIPPILAVLAVLCLRKETLSKWNKYKISLPVRRKNIVQSYYISHLCWCVGGMAVVAVFMAVTVGVHGNQYFYYGFRDAVTLVLGGGVLALFIGSVFYPFYYAFGSDKTEIIAIISAVLSVAVIVGISLMINFLVGEEVSDTAYYISLAAIIVITFVCFIASYGLSAFIFKRKEI